MAGEGANFESEQLWPQFEVDMLVAQRRTTFELVAQVRDRLRECSSQLHKLSDQMIGIFLLSCDNQLEHTLQTIYAFFRCKAAAPEMFDGRDVDSDDLQLAMNTVVMASLPVRTSRNEVVHFFKVDDSRYYNFHLVPIMKLSYMLLDISQRADPPDGLVVLIDIGQIGLMHVTRLKVNAIRKYFQFLQEGLPIKLNVIHIINTVYFFDKILTIVKAFMKSELIEKLRVHPPNMPLEGLHQLVPAKCLPQEYGGELEPLQEIREQTRRQFRELRPHFQNEEAFRHQLSKSEGI